MNAYCTLPQLYQRYDRRMLFDLGNDQDQRQANDSLAQALLDQEASFFDMALAGRYTLPLVPMPEAFTAAVAAKAVEAHYGRRGKQPEGVQKDIDRANALLEQIRKGEFQLPGISRPQPALAIPQRPWGSWGSCWRRGWW